MDVSVVLLLALYRNQEFARVGYYVFTEYDDPELRENPPVKVDFEKAGYPLINRLMVTQRFLSVESKHRC